MKLMDKENNYDVNDNNDINSINNDIEIINYSNNWSSNNKNDGNNNNRSNRNNRNNNNNNHSNIPRPKKKLNSEGYIKANEIRQLLKIDEKTYNIYLVKL